MRRIILLLLIVLTLIMCSCEAEYIDVETNDIDNNDNVKDEDSEITVTIETQENDTPVEKPTGCKLIPRCFETQQEFIDAIKSAPESDINADFEVGGIDFYFVPESIPEDVFLQHIAVKDIYVTFWYQYDEEPDPHWERLFLFTWHRTKKQQGADLEYYITKITPTDTYQGENEYVCRQVEWEQYGYQFHAIVPIWFTTEDIEKYCVAKKVVVE